MTEKVNKQLIRIKKVLSKQSLLYYLFEASSDLQPIMCFNIIIRSKRYSLFPILSGLIEPSLRNCRISLSNGLFPPGGIGRSIPSLRTVLESFLPHTAQPSLQFFWYRILIYHINEIPTRSSPFFGLTKRG